MLMDAVLEVRQGALNKHWDHEGFFGPFEEDDLWFYRTRGLSQEQAETMLLNLFTDDVYRHIPMPPEIAARIAEKMDCSRMVFPADGPWAPPLPAQLRPSIKIRD
eukprot:Selendium_serpulae@DN7171_c0_g1_i1.p1